MSHVEILFSFGSVKLRIKSFRVPELFIEIPETATVGSLKVSNINPSYLACIAEDTLFQKHFKLLAVIIFCSVWLWKQ